MPSLLVAAGAGLVLGLVADQVVAALARREPPRPRRLDAHRASRVGRVAVPVLCTAAAGLVAATTPPGPALVTSVYAAVLLVVLAVVDVHTRRMPNLLTVGSWPVAAVLVALAGARGAEVGADAVLAATAGAVAALALALVRPAALGMGDAKALVALAILMVPLGAPTVGRALVAGLLLSAGWSAIMLVRGRRADARLAAGPFLALGAIGVICLA